MKVLIIGAGVIGTVYGAHLGAAGHTVDVLSHPPRTADIAIRGLAAHACPDDEYLHDKPLIVKRC